jgi:Protein of unknown function (DUF2818)
MMSTAWAVWVVVVFALSAANLPFFTTRVFGLVMLKSPKNVGVRLAELMTLYFVIGIVALLLEKRAGQIAPQTWEFYAVTAALFLTFAFPGFVYRYLLKRSG